MSEHTHCHCHGHDDDCGCGCHHDHGHDDCGCGCHHDHDGEEKGNLLCLVAAGVLLLGAIVTDVLALPLYVTLPLFAAAYLVAGFPVLAGAVRGIAHGEWFGEEFLMTVASLGAFAIGEYAEAVAVMLLFEIGEALQHRAAEKSRRSIREMLELRPDTVTALRYGETVTVAPEDVAVGDILLILPGERVACDGTVTEGCGDMDLSALTGESLPVPKAVGDSVQAGSISLDATFRVCVTAPYGESTVARILDVLEHARASKSRTESFIRRFSKVYTPAVCALAALIAFLPPLLGLGELSTWIYRGLCALAASCPCALVISVPLGFFGGLGAASRAGVLVKGGNFLEALARVDAVAFDKTGTLTEGRFSLFGEENAPDPDRLHRAAAICERYSTHPIATAVTESFGDLAADAVITDAIAIPGRGVRAVSDGKTYLCGSAALLTEAGVSVREATLAGTHVYCAEDGEFLGSMTFADRIKSDTAEALRDLAALGITDTCMLTGDKHAIAKEVAAACGIGTVRAELLPTDKAAAFAAEKAKEKRIAYVGDGINDAPVLALADVGVAMGGIGSAAALEAADAVIMGDSLTRLPAVIRIARRTVAVVRQNIVFSLAVKLVVVLLSALGITGLWVAVFGDVGVCLLAVLNALCVMKK